MAKAKEATPSRTPRKRASAKSKPPVTNDLLCTMVLDMSGSMYGVHDAVIEGVNQYVEDLRNDDSGDTLFSLTVFDSVFEHWHVAEPVENIPSIAGRYIPRGNTALFDAIAHSIREVEKKLRKMKREDMKILHVTMTDGHENSSREYPRDDTGSNRELIALVKEKEDTGNWTFVYLGAGHQNIAQARAAGQSMGYSGGNSMLYANTAKGVEHSTSSLSSVTSTRRSSDAGSTQTAFADAGQSEADYADPAVQPTTPNPIVPQPGDVAKAADVITSKSLGDALKGQ